MKKYKKTKRIQESLTEWKVIVMIMMTLSGVLQSNNLRINIDDINIVVSL